MARRSEKRRSRSSGRRQHRSASRGRRSKDDGTSSDCSCSDCGSSSTSDTSDADDAGRRSKPASRSKSRSRNSSDRRAHSRRGSRDIVAPAYQPSHYQQDQALGVRAVTPELHPAHLAQPAVAAGAMVKPPKIAMVLLLGREEREFRLTEAQILFDSPNDLTSTYYASDPGEEGSPPKSYRMPDRDAQIFEIIYRFMNRENILPLRKSLCPNYLSYEQTLQKLAEEAKFYRLTRLSKALPPPGMPSAQIQPATPQPAYAHPPPSEGYGVQAQAYQYGSEASAAGYSQQPVTLQAPSAQPSMQHSASAPSYGTAPSLQASHAGHPPSHLPTSPLPNGSMASLPPAAAPAQSSGSASISSGLTSRSRSSTASQSQLSRKSSSATSAAASAPELVTPKPVSAEAKPSRPPTPPPRPPSPPPPGLVAYLHRGEAPTRREQPFPIVDYPEDSPLPRLFIKATNAEIKFSAFRNATDTDTFELRYSIRILDEPSTRPLAFRANDTTIKVVDSHLRLNGVISDLEVRDIPIRIQHALPTGSKHDDGSLTSDLDELLELMSSKGYVKWSRIWQDAFDNLTPADSLHQRVSLSSCELLFDLEFPEEAALISAEVGGRGLTLNTQEEEDMAVRNYRVNLHAVKCSTRKMRRLRELDEVGLVVDEGRQMFRTRKNEPAVPRSPAYSSGHASGRSMSRTVSDIGSPRTPHPASRHEDRHERQRTVSSPHGENGHSSRSSSRQYGDQLHTPRPHYPQHSTSESLLSVPSTPGMPSASALRAKHSQQQSYVSSTSGTSDIFGMLVPPPSARSARSAGTQDDYHAKSPSTASNGTYGYPKSPSLTPSASVSSRRPPGVQDSRPPRGHYHPGVMPPETPQTWSNPQHARPQQHPPAPTPSTINRHRAQPSQQSSQRDFRFPTTEPNMPLSQRRSDGNLSVPSMYGARRTSGASQVSMRTTASEEIKRRAMEGWDF